MAKKSKTKAQSGMSPAAKAAVLLVCVGIPLLFFGSSYGLSKIYEIAPWVIVAILVVVATVYTSYTARLLYEFYEVDPPITRFIPCICEISLIDVKFHLVGYILYAVGILFLIATNLPYAVLAPLGTNFATTAPFYFMLIALVALAGVQVVKGIGLMGCIKDIAVEWEEHAHVEVGGLTKFGPLCFIPFVRVIALYSLNKPLSTMVSFMGVTADDEDEDSAAFTEE